MNDTDMDKDLRGAIRRLNARAWGVAGGLVLEATQYRTQDPERRRRDSRGVTGVHAFAEVLDHQIAGDHAAQRRRAPQLVVIAAAGVEADHQAG